MLGNETRGGGVPVSVGLLMMIQSHQLNSLPYQGISECLQLSGATRKPIFVTGKSEFQVPCPLRHTQLTNTPINANACRKLASE